MKQIVSFFIYRYFFLIYKYGEQLISQILEKGEMYQNVSEEEKEKKPTIWSQTIQKTFLNMKNKG